jgi:hypothetical protein
MNTEEIIRMAQEAWGEGKLYRFDSPKHWPEVEEMFVRFANLVAAAEQKATLDTVDELIGMERDRSALFSEGYDHALFHIKQFVEGRGKVK